MHSDYIIQYLQYKTAETVLLHWQICLEFVPWRQLDIGINYFIPGDTLSFVESS